MLNVFSPKKFITYKRNGFGRFLYRSYLLELNYCYALLFSKLSYYKYIYFGLTFSYEMTFSHMKIIKAE